MSSRRAATRGRRAVRMTLTPALLVGAMLALSATSVTSAAAAPGVPDPAPSPYTKPVPGPVIVKPGHDSTPLPDLKTDAFVLADANTGDILAERSLHNKMRPASTLKTLTLLTLVPRLKGDSVYRATEQDTSAEGSRVGMVAGSAYTVNDMFYGLALPSGNDAASGLANAYGGWDKTLAAMNEEAKRIGANDTTAVNPSGLDQADQFSSVHDIAQVFRAGIEDPEFRKIISTEKYTFPDAEPPASTPRGSFEITTQDRLATHDYPGIIGGKTGYTTQAGRTFVVAAERDGHTLVAALFGIGGNTEATSKKLLDWGFANYGKVEPTGQMGDTGAIPTDINPVSAADPQSGTAAAGTTDELSEASTTAMSQAREGSGFMAAVGWLLLLAMAALVALRIRAVHRQKARRVAAEAAGGQRHSHISLTDSASGQDQAGYVRRH